MAQLQISDNVIIELPADVEAKQRPLSVGQRRGGTRMDAVDRALTDAEFVIEAEIELAPVPRASAGDRRGLRSRGTEVSPLVSVSVDRSETAVILLESEGGVFAWLLPEEPTAPGRRTATRRTLTFPLANVIAVSGTTDRRGRRGITSWIANRLIDPVRLRVLRYVATATINVALDRLEGDRPFGLVDMSGRPDTWRPGASLPDFPAGKPANVLLMVHGTFSTTAGSFASLELTPSGRSFLERARAQYDAVIGFDHSTLALDPERNASEILDALSVLPRDSKIDTIGYSRGGLVVRALIEKLAPASRSDIAFGRAVFVGCTNSGTYLAQPENWHALVDLYTNIVMAGARAIALLSANAATAIVASGISTLGRFVKMLPDIAISERKLPGLAAMEPEGTFVTAMNSATAGPTDSRYFVIASDFEPRIEPAKGVTGELAQYLVDRVADRFFGIRENDLVVDTASMWQFGQHSGRLANEDRIVLASEESIYHTIYFAADSVGRHLSDWLIEARARRPTAGARRGGPAGEQRDIAAPTIAPPPKLPGGVLEWTPTRFSVPILESSVGAWNPENDLVGDLDDMDGDTGKELESLDGAGAEPAPATGDRSVRNPTRRTYRRVRAATDEEEQDEVQDTAAAEAEAGSTACHFAAEMQPTPVLGVPVPLFVTISPERIAVAAGATASTTNEAVPVERMKPLEIEVIPSRNCRVSGGDAARSTKRRKRTEGPSLRFIDVPSKSESVRFEIEGIAPGEAEIFIEARQGSRLLASFLLKPVFVVASDMRISASQIAHPTDSFEDDPAVLRIYEMHRADGVLRLRFELSCEKPNIFVQQDVDLRPNFNLGAFVAMFLTKLEDAYGLADYDLMLEEITNFSIVRTSELIPEGVRRQLWQHRGQIKAIQVISEEPLIPWELLCIADPDGQNDERSRFLAEWGLVRWMYNAPWPSRQLSLRPDRVFHVIPDYLNPEDELAGAAEERAMLARRFPGSSALEARSRDVRGFLRDRAASCDLLHFACHGIAEQKAVLSSDLIMREIEGRNGLVEDRLTQDDVKAEAAFGNPSPSGMVFINACQTGRPGEGIAGVMGFADSFVRPLKRQGVNIFVGALWSIDDALALTFADTFYTELTKGKALVDAAGAAREACKQNRDFTWLAYSLYGHPFAKVN